MLVEFYACRAVTGKTGPIVSIVFIVCFKFFLSIFLSKIMIFVPFEPLIISYNKELYVFMSDQKVNQYPVCPLPPQGLIII